MPASRKHAEADAVDALLGCHSEGDNEDDEPPTPMAAAGAVAHACGLVWNQLVLAGRTPGRGSHAGLKRAHAPAYLHHLLASTRGCRMLMRSTHAASL